MDSTDPNVVEEKTTIVRTYRFVWYVLGIIEFILFFRFLFRLTGASVASPFVAFIYAISTTLELPFLYMYPTPTYERNAFEWMTIIAMLVFFIIAYFVVHFFHVIKPVNRKEAERKISEL